MISRLLTPPQLASPEMNRRARLLSSMIGWSLLIAILLGLGLLAAESPPLVLGSVAGLILVLLVSIGFMRRGRIRAAAVVFVFAGWAVTVLPAFLQDNLSSPFVLFSIVMLLLASLLLEPRDVRIITLLSLLAAGLLLLNTLYPVVPQLISSSTPLRRFGGLLAALVAISTIIRLAMGSLQTALAAAEANAERLSDANRLLAQTQAVLEHHVADRTAALEARARQLQVAAEVAGAVASIRNLEALLDDVCGLLSERFNYYHIGVYLLEDDGTSLALRAANTEIGRKLIASGFSLPLNGQSMAAAAARTRQARVAADVRTDDQYLPLDELSLTRSEITLPLISSDNLLGVLDIQNAQVYAPSSDDLTTMRILANQVAIAIENAQLLAASHKSVESLERAYNSLSREGWQNVLRAQPQLGFRAAANGPAVPIRGSWQPDMTEAGIAGKPTLADSHTVAIPIKIRDGVAGVLRLRKPPEAGTWRTDEIALVETLSDRLSSALESARLYEETRRRAERERLTGDITSRLRASNDPQTILQVAAEELRSALKADAARLVIQYEPVEVAP